MFPIPWNFPFRKKNGNVVNIEDAISGGGGGGSDLPSYDSGDAGKILGVDDNGDLEWSDKLEDLTTSVETIETNLGSITESVEGLEEDLTNEVVTRGSLGAKNLLPNNAVSQTINGVTFTVNSNGSVTVNGTATEQALFMFATKYKLPTGNFILSGGIRPGVFVFLNKHMGDTFIGNVVADGEDTPFTIDYSNYDNFWYGVGVNEGLTVNNETFYPMIRLATDSDDTYQPYSMTNRELTPIAQAVSNRNLLDNPWFTVNQRGQSSYTSYNTYTVDRWRESASSVPADFNVTKNSNGTLTLACGSGSESTLFFTQLISFSDLPEDSEQYTFSLLMADGTVYKMTRPLNASSGAYRPITGLALNWNKNANNWAFQIMVSAGYSFNIKAVKLEKGSVSTLHMDTAPNYATELLKCQRYFVAIPETSSFRISMAVNQTPYVVDTTIPLPVAMRAKPSIVNNGVELDITSLDGAGFAGTSWSIPSLPTSAEYSYVVLRVAHNNGLQVGDGTIYVYNKNLELSADL